MFHISNYISREKLKELCKMDGEAFISIYITWEENRNSEKNKITFKNALNEAKYKLKKYKIDNKKIKKLLEPLHEISKERDFWENQSKGIALFRNENEFIILRFSSAFHNITIVDKRFYIRPLIPLYKDNEGRPFHILLMNQDKMQWISFNHNSEKKSYPLPEHLRSFQNFMSQYDHEKSLQYSTKNKDNPPQYHGHGKAQNDERNYRKNFCSAIKNWITSQEELRSNTLHIIGDDKCIGYITKSMEDSGVSVNVLLKKNPNNVDDYEIILQLLGFEKNIREQRRDSAVNYLKQVKSDKETKIIYSIEEIVPAAKNQRIKTLFIPESNQNIWGSVNDKAEVEIYEDQNSVLGEELINVASIQTILNAGHVFQIKDPESADMPRFAAICHW